MSMVGAPVRVWVAGVIAACLCLGCAETNRSKLQRGVTFAVTMLEDVGRNPMAALAFGSNEEQGGTVLTYLAAGMPEDSDLPRFEMGSTTNPWTVVIKNGPAPQDYSVEGYGEDLAKPLIVEHVAITPRRHR